MTENIVQINLIQKDRPYLQPGEKGDYMELLISTSIVVFWIVLNAWILPRMGVST